jgi:tetratricopeptide (TPR) repeat protein
LSSLSPNLALLALLGVAAACAQSPPARIAIDYPADGSVFPPDMAAPTFLWRDSAPSAVSWRFDISFADGSAALHVVSKGERMSIGEIDPRCVSPTNQPPKLTPQQAAAHTWTPDPATWATIKSRSRAGAATVAISGFTAENPRQPVSGGHMLLSTSADPVGAPIFYRDVPLMPSELEKGTIKPLAPSAVPLIAWRLRDVAETRSRVLLEDMHTCANCHSFSGDGKTLGMDLDGPQNDKGLYTLVPVQRRMTIRNEDVISWTSFRGEFGSELREGFMSQVSPDGRRVVTTIKPPGAKGTQFYYVANFEDYRFLQVFYPTRGILVWYDRDTRKLSPLSGADDPRYVQTGAVWSPDGQYLVFARAEAKDPYPANGKMAAYANDPAEIPIQYDLYRVPFNGGKGGKPEAIAGASHNGMSNSFPKISPDGRWIVFVQARNGQLMRPDSRLYIVPAGGGQARPMRCNTPLMNSWHSFSPNGRWLVFSSKSRSPYTQMFLTHIDAEGRDTPAILIDNSTAANRAVNIPEFVNTAPGGIERIDAPAADFYRQFDLAATLAKKGQYVAAIAEWTKALAMSPGDARAHNNFGLTLAGAGKMDEAIAQYREALSLKANYSEAHNNLAIALTDAGRPDEAIDHLQRALDGNPASADLQNNLGRALADRGRVPDAIRHFEAALAVRPDYAEAHNNLATALVAQNRLDPAVIHYRKAIEIDPKFTDAYNNLGTALARQGKFADAVVDFRKALELNPAYAVAEGNLGRALLALDKVDEAIPHLQKALAAGPETAELHRDLGLALTGKNRLDEAIPHFEKAGDHANLGRVYAALERFDEAIPQYQKALERDPRLGGTARSARACLGAPGPHRRSHSAIRTGAQDFAWPGGGALRSGRGAADDRPCRAGSRAVAASVAPGPRQPADTQRHRLGAGHLLRRRATQRNRGRHSRQPRRGAHFRTPTHAPLDTGRGLRRNRPIRQSARTAEPRHRSRHTTSERLAGRHPARPADPASGQNPDPGALKSHNRTPVLIESRTQFYVGQVGNLRPSGTRPADQHANADQAEHGVPT